MSRELYETLFTIWALAMTVVLIAFLIVKTRARSPRSVPRSKRTSRKQAFVLPFLKKVWGRIGKLWKRPKGWSLAKRLARKILSSGEVPDEVRPFVVSPQKCKNCKGDQDLPRWKIAKADAYLREDQLTKALVSQELCVDCLNALVKLVVKTPKKAVTVQADQTKKDDAKKSQTGARYVVKGFLALGFAVTVIFALNFFLTAVHPSDVIRSTGVFGMFYSFGAFLIAAVLGLVASVLLRQLTR